MSDKLRAAALAALEMLSEDDRNAEKCIRILGAALAEPEQEPVAWYDKHGMVTHDPFEGITPLYTALPRREWVGLKDADFEKEKFVDYNFMSGASFAEAKLKEKNCG